jgi:hypothetical protein
LILVDGQRQHDTTAAVYTHTCRTHLQFNHAHLVVVA